MQLQQAIIEKIHSIKYRENSNRIHQTNYMYQRIINSKTVHRGDYDFRICDICFHQIKSCINIKV